MKRLSIIVFAALLLIPSLALAEGVLTPAANPPDRTLYDYRNSISLQDDFHTGTTAAGTIGTLGWTVANGTSSMTGGVAGRFGLLTRTTSTTINTVAYSFLTSAISNALDPSLTHRLVFIHRLNQVDANTVLWTGAGNGPSLAVPDDGIYFEKRAADTNWFCVTRSAAAQTRTDSGVAVTTNFITMSYERTVGQVRFFLNTALVCTHTANITTVFLNPAWVITNTAAADKTVATDYFEMHITGLTR